MDLSRLIFCLIQTVKRAIATRADKVAIIVIVIIVSISTAFVAVIIIVIYHVPPLSKYSIGISTGITSFCILLK